jgi:hypothetical protein
MKIQINKTINRYWRDWAALVYLFICLCDFFIGPLWWNLLMFDACAEVLASGQDCKTTRWEPLTLQGATAWRKKDEVEIHNNTNGNSTK